MSFFSGDMASDSNSIEKKIGERFSDIEQRIRASFQSIRADISSLNDKISSSKPNLGVTSEITLLKEKLSNNFKLINSELAGLKSKQLDLEQKSKLISSNSELKDLLNEFYELKEKIPTKEDISSIKQELNSKINLVKKQISETGIKEEVLSSIEPRIESRFVKFSDKIAEIRQNFSDEFKKHQKASEQEKKELIYSAGKETDKIIFNTDSEIALLKREISKFNNELMNELKERDKKIENLRKQVSQLKNKIDSEKISELEQNQIAEDPLMTKKKWTMPQINFKKTFQVIGIILVLAVLVFLVYFFFFMPKTLTYSYDIGSKDDVKQQYLYPLERVSYEENLSNITYRNITAALVYFDVPMKDGFSDINITIKFQDMLRNNSTISLGVKNSSSWVYDYQVLYNRTSYANFSDWITVSKNFGVDELYIKDNKANFVINTPILADYGGTLPIDWINITLS